MAQQQLSLAPVQPLPNGNERYLWRTDPQRAFEAYLRTKLYTPRTLDGTRTFKPRPYSAQTRKSYGALFHQYVAFLAAHQIHVVDASAAHIAAFLDTLPGRAEGRASTATRRRAFNALDWAYGKLLDLGLRRDQPVKPLVPRYTTPEDSPQSSVLLPSEHEALLAHIAAMPRDRFKSARRAAMLAVAIGCGVCGDELRKLKRGQLALKETPPILRMDACGLRSEVVLPLADHTVRILTDWWRIREAAGATGELLFPAAPERDEPIGLQTLHRYAVAALAAVGRQERVGAQRVLRASFAVRQLSHTDDPDQVRRWLRLKTDKMIERFKRQVMRPDQRIV